MRETKQKMNAMRSGVVIIGALAFGYLTLQLGFKPFLLKAQETLHSSDQNLQNSPRVPDSAQTSDS